jgi:hypothetical protein
MVGATGGDELETELAVVCGGLNQLSARLVTLAAGALESEAWAGAGIRSPEHWLVLRAGLSPGRARQVVLMARRATALPVVMGQFASGLLSVDQVAVVARHAPSHVEASVAELAVSASVPQLSRVLSRYAFDPPTGEEPDPEATGEPGRDGESAAEPGAASTEPPLDDGGRAAAPAELSMTTREGRFELRFSAPADAGALVQAAVAEAKDALFAAGVPQVTWADALVEICQRSLAGVTSPGRRDSFRVYVHLDADGGWLNGAPRLPGHLVRKLTCEGTMQPLWERAGVPVSVGRALRIVPERTRRLVLDRDRGCRFPGCSATSHLQVHHIRHWAAGGCTDMDNLVALCPFHHDAHHAGQFGISGDPNDPTGLVFTAPGGFPILPVLPVPAYPTPGQSAADPEPAWVRLWTSPPGPEAGPGPDAGGEPGSGPRAGPDAALAPELGVGYPGATGEVLQGKWVTFHERDPLLI